MIHLETGKYAFYVWTAYGVSAAVMAVMVAGALAHARRWKAKFEALNQGQVRK
ncbi:heme exporter protein CcmD [Phenylobacterium sp.]|uniref:heme exporter protein CcmD n=1 Tax=Phenylobacterium sp. TaxID=1871053 RepID=UPI0011F629A6|nr:heme exporter protein CcmD [Phenylobacterium sp.]THD57732.1 MAG: heme exporter protein CcmD [Phenylobacterium sp.]